MTRRVYFGGLILTCDSGGVPLAEADPAYRGFLYPDPSIGCREIIEVQLEPGVTPPPPEATPIFEAPGAWRAAARDSSRWLVHAPVGAAPEWSVAFSLDTPRRFAVGYSPELVNRADDPPTLRNPVVYPLDYLLMMYALLNKGVILHACGVISDGRCVLFSGPSGAGKSTMARLWMDHPDATVISDDRVILRWIDGTLHAFGTPWLGDAGVARNAGAPVCAVGYLKQSPTCRIRPLSAAEALPRLLKTVSLPWFDRSAVADALDLCGRLTTEIPQFETAFVPAPDFFAHIGAMQGVS